MRSGTGWRKIWLGFVWDEADLTIAGIGGRRSRESIHLLHQQPHLTHPTEMLTRWLSSLPGKKTHYFLAGVLAADLRTLTIPCPPRSNHRARQQWISFHLQQEGYHLADWHYDFTFCPEPEPSLQLVLAPRARVLAMEQSLGTWASRLRLLTWPGQLPPQEETPVLSTLPVAAGASVPPLRNTLQACQALQLAWLGLRRC